MCQICRDMAEYDRAVDAFVARELPKMVARTESVYEDTILAMAAYERANDERHNFCRICWGPFTECPGHKGYMEMFGPPPTEQEKAEYLADLEVRARGLDRKHAALDAAAVEMGYESIEDLAEKNAPGVDS